MLKKSYEKLLEQNTYTEEEINNSALIIHPSDIKKYGLVKDQIFLIFEEGSNFTTLKNPIIDEFNNEYWDSEGFYMSQRTDNLEIKKLIAFCSIGNGLSKKAAYLQKNSLDNDIYKKIDYMRNAIRLKFDNNPNLRQLLLETKDKEIIEYTYWGDDFFGIDNTTKTGSNILGKLLVEYRENYK